ncbi:hypothetical protein MNV49_007839 [Pseudohyphozyma bogoriensis]|nr:hypothetical protein MNV49_007839 [Pseudohyphozyma bogoriensis]
MTSPEPGTVEGPFNLVKDAIASPLSTPPVLPSPSDTEFSDTSTNNANTMSQTATTDESRDPSPPPQGQTKTTITTTSQAGTTTDSLIHTNAAQVTSRFAADGSVSLRPIPARGTSASKIKTKRQHTFKPRISRFDRDNPESAKDPFRGFHTLFWIMVSPLLVEEDVMRLIFIGAVRTGVNHYHEAGVVWGMRFATLISEDAKMLAVSDGVMVLSTILCVPFVQLINRRWLSYYWTGAVIQHVAQALFLGLAVRWTFYRSWPWVQSGFMTLHSLSLLMKVHSYISTNGELSEKKKQLGKIQFALDEAVEDAGGKKKVEKEAHEAWVVSVRASEDGVPISTANGSTAVEENGGTAMKRRVVFPENVTYFNFFDYLLVPTLVYELEYPRTKSIRPVYILEKTLATFGTFSILVLIVEHYILPISPGVHERGFWHSALDLAMPFMVCYLLIFYIIFESICNGFAELTRFSDREFYQDWWNSTSFDEFSRRWNVPVHSFLLRHVYTSTITTYHFSKFQAAFVTFLLSALVHELVMAVVTQKIRPYLFGMQMAQLPLIMIGRLPIMRKYPALGNLFFWLGLMAGFPLLAVSYLRF